MKQIYSKVTNNTDTYPPLYPVIQEQIFKDSEKPKVRPMENQEIFVSGLMT